VRNQNDLKTVAKFTDALVRGLNDPGQRGPDHKIEDTASDLASAAETTVCQKYSGITDRCLAYKAEMARACAHMLSEVDALEQSTKKAASRLNDVAGKVSQSLAKTRDLMGPNVEDRLKQLERFCDVMERLHALNSDGTIDKFAAALKNR
jgi:uncharacterized protein Yka (UPF0111/DUF47 family)